MSQKNVKRREFLHWMAVGGLGGLSGLQAVLPQKPAIGAANLVEESDKTAVVPQQDGLSYHVFSKHLQFLGYREMAEAAAEIGFDGVDLTVRPGGHVEPERVAAELPKAVDAMRQHNLQPAMMTTAISDAADATTANILQTAAELGIRYYRTDWLWYNEQQAMAENLSHFRGVLEALARLNQKHKLIGDYQNHAGFGGYPLGSPIWDLAGLLDDIRTPYMGCQYDIRHATVEGATSWPLGLQRIRSHIHTLVVKDFTWGKKEGKWQIINTPIGEGMVDFPKFFSLLKEYQITAPVSVHFEYELPEQQKGLSKKQVREQTIQLMQKDLAALKKFQKETGL